MRKGIGILGVLILVASSSFFVDIRPGQAASLAAGGGSFAWDGKDPFHQPAATSDYTGSGDVDGDGAFTAADLTLAQRMAGGLAAPNVRADVNGDGAVDSEDALLIQEALAGGRLPAWWNQLASRAERDAWVTRVLALDLTNQHPYFDQWFVCYDFAVQLFLHAAFDRADLLDTQYDGGQTFFNLPMYMVSISSPGFGHAIDAILVGDDPLSFADWRFIEPQTDQDFNWDSRPVGTQVNVNVQDQVASNHASISTRVVFAKTETGWVLTSYSPDLLLSRGQPTSQAPDNHADLWNPRVLPLGSGLLFYERAREDLTRTTDIFMAGLPFVDPSDGSPLVGGAQYSRLLDAAIGPDGKVYLLWKGKPDYNPGIFQAVLDPRTSSLVDTRRVVSNDPFVRMGRIVALPNGDLYAFWLKNPAVRDDASRGIYWTRLKFGDTVWEAPEKLSTPNDTYPEWPGWVSRDLLRYHFDVAVLANGDMWVAWAEPRFDSDQSDLYTVLFEQGAPGAPVDIGTDDVRGVALAVDSTGVAHLAYWLGKRQDQYGAEGRGNLVTREYLGGAWSEPQMLDDSGGACCARMAAGAHGDVYLVWERETQGAVAPVWREFSHGAWSPAQTLEVRAGAQAWYPGVAVFPGERPVFYWSARSADEVSLQTTALNWPVFLPAVIR